MPTREDRTPLQVTRVPPQARLSLVTRTLRVQLDRLQRHAHRTNKTDPARARGMREAVAALEAILLYLALDPFEGPDDRMMRVILPLARGSLNPRVPAQRELGATLDELARRLTPREE